MTHSYIGVVVLFIVEKYENVLDFLSFDNEKFYSENILPDCYMTHNIVKLKVLFKFSHISVIKAFFIKPVKFLKCCSKFGNVDLKFVKIRNSSKLEQMV